MRNQKRFKAIAAASAIGAMALAACGDGSSAASNEAGTLEDMEPVVLTISDPNPESASNVIALNEWMEYVTEETGGKVTFDTYFSGTLHDGTEALSSLEQGITDITFYYPGYFPDQLPIANWVTRTFAVDGIDGFPHSGLANSAATMVLYEESEDLRKELAEYNAIPLTVWGGGTYDLLCTSPVDSLEAAKGKLVNTAGEPWIEEVQEIGMTAEFIEIPEEYEALQRGVIDCISSTVSPMMSRGSWEVATHYTPVDLSPSLAVGYMFNKEVWESLPLEVRQIMHDGKSIIIGGFEQIANERYAEFAEEAEGMGVEFHDPSELNAALKSYQTSMAGRIIEEAPDSAENPQEALDLFRDNMDQWSATLVDDLGVERVEKTPENLQDLYVSVRDIDWAGYEDAIQETLEAYRPE